MTAEMLEGMAAKLAARNGWTLAKARQAIRIWMVVEAAQAGVSLERTLAWAEKVEA